MGRRRIESAGQDSQPKLKKKKLGANPANNNSDVNVKPGLKLRLILGREAIGEKSFSADEVDVDSLDVDDLNDTKTSSTFDETLQDDMVQFNDDDEEAWLDALEKGDLDDYGELKKEKDPSLMTARQRAMKERTSVLSSKSFVNVSLLGATRGTQEMTEEMKKRKEEKNKRRKLQAVKRAEENQKQTIERLVKHQESKGTKERKKKENTNVSNTTSSQLQKPVAKTVPMIKYVSRENSITLSYPEDMECPLKAKTGLLRREQPPCLVCGGVKKYSCSKTGVPLCSLSCYKINLIKVVVS